MGKVVLAAAARVTYQAVSMDSLRKVDMTSIKIRGTKLHGSKE